jgi:NDP-sugar pyrophosphorylase family protein
MIPALVLTAGLATRLRPLSFVRAKAAVPVAGVPLITRILRGLKDAGITDAVLNLHHLPHTITRIVGDGSDVRIRIRYSWEQPVLGSAGGPRQALPLIGTSPFLIVNGDTLADVDIPALIDGHRRSGALVTMAVTENIDPDKYGGIIASPDGVMTGYAKRGSGASSNHFVGVQVAESEAFAALAPGTPHESIAALYPALMQDRPGSVRVHLCAGEFFDIGTPGDYLKTSLHLGLREHRGLDVGRGVLAHPTARIEDSVLWDDVEVGEGAFLRQCIVTDGARIPGDTSWIGVTLRRANGELAPGERRIGDLAVGSF